jgi:hypothetical protein
VKKEPCQIQVTDKVHIDFIKFDMFMLENLDAYVGVQAPISIDESIQPLVIIGSTTIATTYLVIDVPSGGEIDRIESAEEDVATYDNDGYNLHLPFICQI